MKLSVVIPSYMRPADLERCLTGISEQQRQPDQVIVVVREDDLASASTVEAWATRLPVEICRIAVPGVVQALNMALLQVSGDVVTITDDDTFALNDWLLRIEEHFTSDPKLGGVGGRDLIHEDGRILPAVHDKVGVLLSYGRLVGSHHLGRGQAREVDHLKGVNMSWRVAAMNGRRFATELRGGGAQVYFELAFSFDIQRRGWRIVYDPAIQVHHFVAPRHDNDKRCNRDLQALENAAFNLYVAFRKYLRPGFKREMALVWAHYVGTFGHPGVVRGIIYHVQGKKSEIEVRGITARAWVDAKALCSYIDD